jgi:5-oxoprolinase (ATP-hydrolysing) subunit A
MPVIDINCDMGEGIGNDELIMPFISSASIACGYHAGDENTMRETLALARHHRIAVGAHISFADRENFGRTEMHLSPEEIHKLTQEQLNILSKIAGTLDLRLNHVKPHGALYNMSAKNGSIAKAIAQAVIDFDRRLILFGLSDSASINEASSLGLKTASEVFADRTYQDDGSLTPRSKPNALIEDNEQVIQHALQMIHKQIVTTVSGKQIPVVAETICIHGDGAHAVSFARTIYKNLKQNRIAIQAP